MKNHIGFTILACVLVAGGAFYGGMQYASAKTKSTGSTGQFRQGGAFGGQGRNGGTGRANGGFVNGEVLSKDDKSVTIKLTSGGSKIVFFTTSTHVGKLVDGTADDLAVGKTVTVTGDANSDGSVTAQSIQIRPAGALFPQGGANAAPATK